MAEKKKSIIDEAVLDAKRIQETLNANTKEILRSIAKEEIDDLVKESLNEFEEEDVEDLEVNTDDAEIDADAEAPVDGVEDVETDNEIEDIDADVTKIGLPGSPTKVKSVVSIVLTASEAKVLSESDSDIEGMIKELIENHTIG